MSRLPLIAAGLVTVVVVAIYLAVLIGMRREARWERFEERPPGCAAGFARRVNGCYVRRDASSTRPTPSRPPRRGRSARPVRRG